MKMKVILFSVCFAACALPGFAENGTGDEKGNNPTQQKADAPPKKSRLTLGGYGEAVYSRNFYSDSWNRYKNEANIEAARNAKHGRFDLPHVVIFLGYDFGKGWTMGSEIEFEHGGTESAMEIEDDEGGEYESEIERGGEVALEQFWIQKAFSPEFNVKVGHIIVPVGSTNQHHLPTEYFGVYRPEGENTIMPCTWHETGISVWGHAGDWRYEALLIPGLDSDRFGTKNWIQGGAGSPYEFKVANSLAGAFRVDNFSVSGLRLSLSGYVGNSFNNTLAHPNSTWDDVKGTVLIGAFDFSYNACNWVVRGSFDYGHLSDSDRITAFNKQFRNDAPSPKQNVASDAMAAGLEAGYDIFSQLHKKKEKKGSLYAFARYDYYDAMYKTANGVLNYQWTGRHRIAAGLNYYPIKEIVLKGEYSIGLMKRPYNNEPAISFGVAYAGFFTK